MTQDAFRRRLAAGESLFSAGDAGDCAYLIESGAIEVYLEDAGGARRSVNVLRKGEFIGEMALIDRPVRAAGARALEPSTLLIIGRDDFEQRLRDSDPLVQHLLRIVVQRGRGLLQPQEGGGVRPQDPAELVQELQLINSVKEGLERREFVLYYQPIIQLADQHVCGFEALIRWNRPEHGILPPGQFIPLAEQSELIVHIGRWALEQACADLQSLKELTGVRSPYVSVNLSGRQLADIELVDLIARTLKREQIAPQQLKLEVTETLLADNMDAANALLLQCKLLGVTVALDDFGIGHSSLSYLHRFPADTLKLDRSFIENINRNVIAQKIVRAVTRLARELGMVTVAEGMETPEQAEMLPKLGVEYGQGYWFGRPLSLTDLRAWARQRKTA